jgi:predicted N-formylglutamate amidohydrolase
MSEVAEFLPGEAGSELLLVADHASSAVPADIPLGIGNGLRNLHVAVDIGVDSLARDVAGRLGSPAILAKVSRLVVDLHRERGDPNAIPALSDGHRIPGNSALSEAERERRLARFWDPYHALIESKVTLSSKLLVGLHSFTPRLATRPQEERPWEIGILYNRDDRAARIAIRLLEEAGIVTGDNCPYSGRELNATMDRHAEARGLPYLVVEVRQDLIGDPAGVRLWAGHVARIVRGTAAALAGAKRPVQP